MKKTLRLIKRFILLVIVIMPMLFALNLALFVAFTYRERSSNSGWEAAKEIGRELAPDEGGSLQLSEAGERILAEFQAWGILVEDGTGDVIWHSEGLPDEIPLHYSAAEISWYTRGYIRDYPTTVGARGDDLVILGHPKTAYWKLMWNTFDYQSIAEMPKMLLSFLAMNSVLIFLIYMVLATRILRSVKPVVEGLEMLPMEEVHVREKGFLAEVAAAVNRVNEKLRAQERAIRKKENARAGWISGVSHDIRTPLTMVMGYAAEMEEDEALPGEIRKKAEIIRLQSMKMKNLVGDLNLASKLEYQMQPVKPERLNLKAVLRQAAVDFMNLDLEGKYPIEFRCDEKESICILQGDKELLLRAVVNVLGNSRQHNPEGCHISITLRIENQDAMQSEPHFTPETPSALQSAQRTPSVLPAARQAESARSTVPVRQIAHILIEDDGVGVTDEELETIRNTPHYMMGSGSGVQLRHGLGLLIVRQITAAHSGQVRIDHSPTGGFLVEILLPVNEAVNLQ
ncbi:sensor histidine kinase KdpD [uncultured Acetatifactor sp.]|uniref:sensor histidine kinase n=1 Tax=uncultured Acetatifactor sp. TaxID=1671927 RepID=UPI00262C982A|nr:HAMP domain-containing sensor histidine kinase [uncultured Acetatifactor sp.]